MSENTKVSPLSIGLVRGLIGLIIGMVVGLLLVTAIRMLMGLPAWDWGPEANSSASQNRHGSQAPSLAALAFCCW